MATYNGNDAYISIDGTSLATYFVSLSYEPSLETVDVTAGSSTTWRERAEGLKDASATLTVVYDVAYAATMLPLVEVGTHSIIYGPEGSATGKPKHAQSFIITSVPHEVNVEKSRVALTCSMEAAAAPTTDMFSGGVW
jgi:hypothetical protein